MEASESHMDASLTAHVATALAAGESFRVDLGWFGSKPVMGCVDRCVSVAGHGVYVFGWLADPADQVSGFTIEVAHLRVEPLAEGDAVARPDVLASLERELRGALPMEASEEGPGFAVFVKGLARAPELVRTILELRNGEVRVFETVVADTIEETFAFVRDAGWPLLAAHLPEDSAELPPVWRDALFRLLWLTEENSIDAVELSAYLK